MGQTWRDLASGQGFRAETDYENHQLHFGTAYISFNEDYAKGILKYAKLIPEFRRGTVVYAGAPASVAGIDFVNFRTT